VNALSAAAGAPVGFTSRTATKNPIAQRAFLAGGLVLLGACAVWLDVPLCPTAALLGIPCPGCGLTRAVLSALRGNWIEALHFHPLVFVLAPVYVTMLVPLVWQYLRGPDPRPPASAPEVSRGQQAALTTLLTLLLVACLGVWLARFRGYLGGPVAVTSARAWVAMHLVR
jgi:hypothetical protein